MGFLQNLETLKAGATVGPICAVLLVIIVLLLLGALPTWPHSQQWGYLPSGGLGVILMIFLVLMLIGRI